MVKMKEKKDEYYIMKYHLTEEELEGYKKQKEEIGDPDLIIEDLIPSKMVLSLSDSEKIRYLTKLRKKIITVLYLIEEQNKDPENPDKNPDSYIESLLFDLNGANLLFNNDLTEIIIKLYGVRQNYQNTEYNVIRKQILETRRITDDLLAILKGTDQEKNR